MSTGSRIWIEHTLNHVPSVKNKADVLTRVKISWLSSIQGDKHRDICNASVSLEDVHNLKYMGVKRTLYLTQKLDPGMRRESVKKVVRDVNALILYQWYHWIIKSVAEIEVSSRTAMFCYNSTPRLGQDGTSVPQLQEYTYK